MVPKDLQAGKRKRSKYLARREGIYHSQFEKQLHQAMPGLEREPLHFQVYVSHDFVPDFCTRNRGLADFEVWECKGMYGAEAISKRRVIASFLHSRQAESIARFNLVVRSTGKWGGWMRRLYAKNGDGKSCDAPKCPGRLWELKIGGSLKLVWDSKVDGAAAPEGGRDER